LWNLLCHDVANNLKEVRYGETSKFEKSVSYTYDPLNRITAMRDWLGETTYDLDILGGVQRIKDYRNNVIRFQWGLMGEKKSVSYPDGSEVQYEFDANRRIEKAVSGNEVMRYIYNPAGTTAKEILPNCQTMVYQYDALHRI